MSFFRNAATTLATSGLRLPLGLLTGIVLARYLAVEDRGLYAVLIAFATLLFQVCELGWSAASIYRMRRLRVDVPRVISAGVAANLAIAAVAGGLALALREPISERFLEGASPLAFSLALASVPCLLLGALLRGVARGLDRFDLHNAYGLLQALGLLALLGALLIGAGGGLDAALAAYLLANGGGALWIGATLWRAVGFARFELRELGGALRFGVKAYLQQLALTLHEQVDVVVVTYLLGPAPTAVYAVAKGFVNRLNLIPADVATALYPRLAESGVGEAARFTLFVTRHALAWMLLFACALLWLGPPLIPLLFGQAYAPSVAPFLWLLPGMAGITLSRVVGRYFMAIDRQGPVIGARLGAMAANVGLNLALVPALGIVGAALARLVSSALEGLAILALFLALTGQGPRSLVRFGKADLEPYRRRLRALRGPGERRPDDLTPPPATR